MLSIITIMFPPLGLPIGLYGIKKDNSNWRIYIFLISLFFAVLAYCFQPKMETDLFRYFLFIEELKDTSFNAAINDPSYGMNGQGLFFFTGICWLLGKINDPHLLPAISTFLVYYIALYIICHVSEDIESGKKDVLVVILFFLISCNCYSIINNVRNVLAFSIVSMAVFQDLYLNKKKWWLFVLYLVPVFIHPTALLLIAIRVVIRIAGKVKIPSLIIILFSQQIVLVLYNLSLKLSGSGVIGFIKRLLIKIYNYYFFHDLTQWAQTVQDSLSELIFKIIYVAISIILCFFVYKLSKSKDSIKGNDRWEGNFLYLDYAYFIGLLVIVSAQSKEPTYWRFAAAQIIASSAMILYIRKYLWERYWMRRASILLYLLAFCGFALWMRNLLRYSVLIKLLVQPFINSPIVILIKDFANLIVT